MGGVRPRWVVAGLLVVVLAVIGGFAAGRWSAGDATDNRHYTLPSDSSCADPLADGGFTHSHILTRTAGHSDTWPWECQMGYDAGNVGIAIHILNDPTTRRRQYTQLLLGAATSLGATFADPGLDDLDATDPATMRVPTVTSVGTDTEPAALVRDPADTANNLRLAIYLTRGNALVLVLADLKTFTDDTGQVRQATSATETTAGLLHLVDNYLPEHG